HAGISWGLPPVDVNCCGESLKKVGDLELFTRLKEKNLKFFKENDVKKIIVVSPHCMYTFKKEYSEDYEVIHFTELLADLIKQGKLTPTRNRGGVGGLWMEKLKGERLSDLRIEEAWSTGASVLATACPYCITMFEDSVRTLNADNIIKVKDVSELFLEGLGLTIEDQPQVDVCAVR